MQHRIQRRGPATTIFPAHGAALLGCCLWISSLATACDKTGAKAPATTEPPPSAGADATAGTGTPAAGDGGRGGDIAAPTGAAGDVSASGRGGDGGRSADGGRGGRGGRGRSDAGSGGSTPAGTGGSSAAAGEGGASGSQAGNSGAAGSTASAGKKFVGNITTSGQVRSDFVMFWDQITPENEGKWGSVEGQRDQMNWAGLDRVHEYARMHGLIFKQHTLVWGSQQPSWLAGLPAAEQRAEVEEWIRLFCERYPDVALIDVVNEPPPHTTPVYMDALGGAGSSGYDWIVQSFKWARQYCPKAILILNDYNNIEYAGDNTRFLDIVNRIRTAGAPIDALGAQAHDAHKLSNAAIQGFLGKLTATGLPVYITEYDINLASDRDQEVAMQNQFALFWEDPKVHGITLWGYVTGATWRPNTGLMSSSGTQRPAMSWLMDYLGR